MADLDWGFAENGGEAHEFVDKIIQIKIQQTPLSTLTCFVSISDSTLPSPLVLVLYSLNPFDF